MRLNQYNWGGTKGIGGLGPNLRNRFWSSETGIAPIYLHVHVDILRHCRKPVDNLPCSRKSGKIEEVRASVGVFRYY